MEELYPLVFAPVFKERVWGGRRLSRWFPELPPGPIGEAWILSDHPNGPTAVSNGPLAGETLGALQERFGARLLGAHGAAGKTGRFPLLFKLLDCHRDLSVQVHPPDEYEGLPDWELGKAEMWVVLESAPGGSRAVYGLRPGITREDLAQAMAGGRVMEIVNQVPVFAGDVLDVPTGTVHALGEGLVVAEIQQNSDTTYRLFDYGRLGLDGRPALLHAEDSLRVTDFSSPPRIVRARATDPNEWVTVCQSSRFVVARAQCTGRWVHKSLEDTFQVVMLLEGHGSVVWEGGEVPLRAGQAVLLPARLQSWTLTGHFQALRVFVPCG